MDPAAAPESTIIIIEEEVIEVIEVVEEEESSSPKMPTQPTAGIPTTSNSSTVAVADPSPPPGNPTEPSDSHPAADIGAPRRAASPTPTFSSDSTTNAHPATTPQDVDLSDPAATDEPQLSWIGANLVTGATEHQPRRYPSFPSLNHFPFYNPAAAPYAYAPQAWGSGYADGDPHRWSYYYAQGGWYGAVATEDAGSRSAGSPVAVAGVLSRRASMPAAVAVGNSRPAPGGGANEETTEPQPVLATDAAAVQASYAAYRQSIDAASFAAYRQSLDAAYRQSYSAVPHHVYPTLGYPSPIPAPGLYQPASAPANVPPEALAAAAAAVDYAATAAAAAAAADYAAAVAAGYGYPVAGLGMGMGGGADTLDVAKTASQGTDATAVGPTTPGTLGRGTSSAETAKRAATRQRLRMPDAAVTSDTSAEMPFERVSVVFSSKKANTANANLLSSINMSAVPAGERRRKGLGWWVVVGVLVVLAGGAVVVALVLTGVLGRSGRNGNTESGAARAATTTTSVAATTVSTETVTEPVMSVITSSSTTSSTTTLRTTTSSVASTTSSTSGTASISTSTVFSSTSSPGGTANVSPSSSPSTTSSSPTAASSTSTGGGGFSAFFAPTEFFPAPSALPVPPAPEPGFVFEERRGQR
ncbi:hypothetical protein HDU96_008742 [Phlyctochytrium bullatum]|nr:hypothetical protein HDU96_008742 [Phlyctochytrium bullatum]